ncbi:MAG: RES family NAD+ phosphorylase [Pseudomonadota bacterium]
MERGLVRTWSAGTKLFRGRNRKIDATWPLNLQELGPPPNEKALTQRMSPAGISYLYLSTEQETVLAEIQYKPPCQVAMASCTLRHDLRLLDLTSSNFPSLPSIFDQTRRHEYESLLFLMDFANKISERVEKDGREHIDYVPSQVVSEYFAKIFLLNDGSPLDGMAYESAALSEGINVVLFPPKKGRGFSELVNFADPVLLPSGDSSHTETNAGDPN